MASSEVEQLQIEIFRELCELPRDALVELCDFLCIAGGALEHVTGKSRGALIKIVSRHMQRDELEKQEDDGMTDLLLCKDKMTELLAAANLTQQQTQEADLQEEQRQKEREEERIRKEIEALQLQLAATQKQSEKDKSDTREIQTPAFNSMLTQSTPHSYPPTPWHKDLKISGQIGEPGQKDRLTFSSLARQIEHGRSKGVPEPEIVDAVIRSIIPGMGLRSYLEGKANLTLPTLRRILRSHYQEKSATELYKQLTSEVQGIKETPQNFLIRTFDLRQKILFASQEDESGLKYDPGLVQNMFLHTVLTGLQNDNIKRDLQPYLEQTDISDELLLERMNTACAYETERQNKKKLLGQPRPATIHAVQSSDTPVEKSDKSPGQQNSVKLPPTVALQLEEMRSEMAVLRDLKAEMCQIRESMQQPQSTPQQPQLQPQHPLQQQVQYHPPQRQLQLQYTPQQPHTTSNRQNQPQGYWFPPGPGQSGGTAQYQQRFAPQRSFPPPNRGRMKKCFGCQQRGTEEYCTHCFRCGSSEHYLAGCRVRGQQEQFGGEPLNEDGSLAWGRE
ncbi:hypothetical protein N1851_028947 [Merluccius polli]|uniref:Uncharacterized protein n=1 Tax=Merluccius polli TaxID=89951 RepID=A0AA47NS43_MERPO|nr:hypothetical protein N1851_028947 [Merluccius polli]